MAQMVMKKVEQELGPSRAEELADAIVMVRARHSQDSGEFEGRVKAGCEGRAASEELAG